MDHVVYLDYKAKELYNLSIGKKTMIMRGAMGRKVPYERAKVGDELYFVENKGDLLVKAKGIIKEVFFSDKLSREESFALIDLYQNKLVLNTALKKRFAGKRYITLITISDFIMFDKPFMIDKSDYSNMDDWLIVKEIENVRRSQEVA
ncbi:MAG: hypothetical protein P1U56_21470 [Saprospiraceae bacterium]|nr:hypothetical protein [Saprospiraceae bacterium]